MGLWSSNHFVIYYRDGRVPQPGIIILGQITGDVSIFDRPGPITVRVERIDCMPPGLALTRRRRAKRRAKSSALRGLIDTSFGSQFKGHLHLHT